MDCITIQRTTLPLRIKKWIIQHQQRTNLFGHWRQTTEFHLLITHWYRMRGFIHDTLFSQISRKLHDSWNINLWAAISQVKCIISYWNKEGSSWKFKNELSACNRWSQKQWPCECVVQWSQKHTDPVISSVLDYWRYKPSEVCYLKMCYSLPFLLLIILCCTDAWSTTVYQ